MVIKKTFEELSNYELWQIAMLRSNVFTIEQKILEEELEDKDYKALHYFIKEDNKIIAYARMIDNKLGRVCTNINYRNKGYQTKIIKTIMGDYNSLIISAQLQVVNFYKNLGFKEEGVIYLEANIKHIKMTYNKESKGIIK